MFSESRKVDQLVNLMRGADQESLTPVKTWKYLKVIEASKTIVVSCRANLGFTDRKIPMSFLADTQHLPEGLQVQDCLIAVKPGNTLTFQLTVTNASNHDIRLPGRTLMGHLEPVSSVIPFLTQDTEAKEYLDAVVTAAVNTKLVKETQVSGFSNGVNLEGLTEKQQETVMSMLATART